MGYETLLPCPLCNSQDGPRYVADAVGDIGYVVCSDCELMLHDKSPEKIGSSIAIWNDRTKGRFCIESDDDGHWYVIPIEAKKQFREWLEVVEAYPPVKKWNGHDFEINRIPGSLCHVTFRDYQIPV
jgi:transcription elongation factor Elf1